MLKTNRLIFAMLSVLSALPVAAEPLVVDLGSRVPSAEQVMQGLFPEDACEALRQNGFKCMGFKPAVRFSIPNAHFQLGSATLPDTLKKQLDVFAQVLSSRTDEAAAIVVTGHADATGTAEVNQNLSVERARAVRSYLIGKGVPPQRLQTQGMGSAQLLDQHNPFAAINRRVEIGRLP